MCGPQHGRTRVPLPAIVLTEKRTLIPSHEHIHTDTHHNGITTPLRPFDYTRESRITEHTQKPVNNTGVYSVGRRWLAYIHIRIRGPCTCKRGRCCTEVGTDALEGANFPRSSAVPPVCPHAGEGEHLPRSSALQPVRLHKKLNRIFNHRLCCPPCTQPPLRSIVRTSSGVAPDSGSTARSVG